MMKEYRTIHEISGPLMVVEQVEGVTYDELAEIELSDGSIRRCKVLEVNGSKAVVQLFESSAGINLRDSKIPPSCRRNIWISTASPSTRRPATTPTSSSRPASAPLTA